MRINLLLGLLLSLSACDDVEKLRLKINRPIVDSINFNVGDNVDICSPTFTGNLRNTTVNIGCGPSIPYAARAKLEAYLNEQLRTSNNQNDYIDRLRKEAADWEKRFREQEANLREALALMPNDELLKAAQQALQQGDLEQAAQLREQHFQQTEEKVVAKLAAEAYQVGKAFQPAFKPLQALPYLEKAHRYQPADMDYGFAYAVALQDQNQRQPAEAVYQDLLKTARADTGKPENMATLLNNLANLVGDDPHRRGEAEKYYQEAMDIYHALAKDKLKRYLPNVADTLSNLATLVEADTGRHGEAEKQYREALDIQRRLARDNPAVYLPNVVNTLNHLAALTKANTQRRNEAEKQYREVLNIRRTLARDNPAVYLLNVANTLNHLAALVQANTLRRDEAKNLLQEALDIYRTLAKDNPAVYLPEVAQALNNLANLVSDDTQESGEAEKLFREALNIYRALAKNNPAVYLPDVATMQNALANLFRDDSRRRDEAEKLYGEVLDMDRKLAKDNPAVYLPNVANTLNNLATLISDDPRRQGEAEMEYREELDIYRTLAKSNPSVYRPNVATILNNLAILAQNDTRRRGEAEKQYREAMEIRRSQAKDNPSVFQPDLADALVALGAAQLHWQDKPQARVALREAANTLRPFAQQVPGVFGNKQATILFLLAQASENDTQACLAVEEGLGFAQREGLKTKLTQIHATCDEPSAPVTLVASNRQR